MGRIARLHYIPLALVLGLAACSHVPAPTPAPVAMTDANGQPIPPRPHVFGRHAWDMQYGDAAQRAQSQKTAPQPAPAPVVALAPPPPPPPPPVIAQPAAAPQPVATPEPTVVAAAPVVATPSPAPVVQAPPPPAVVQAPPPPVQVAAAPPPPVPALPAPKPAPAKQKGLVAILKDLRTPPPPPLAGGYQTATDMKAVHAAADFAVKEAALYDLKAIYSAKVQVVAGTNYSLCLWVRQKDHEANPLHRRMVAATVFQGLDGHYELSSWQEVNVCHAGA